MTLNVPTSLRVQDHSTTGQSANMVYFPRNRGEEPLSEEGSETYVQEWHFEKDGNKEEMSQGNFNGQVGKEKDSLFFFAENDQQTKILV